MIPLFAFAAASAAEVETTVLVSTLQARNPESAALAALVENFLAQELEKSDGIDVLRVEDTPAFDDYSARVYMEGCPPGDVVGCTYVIGDRGHAEYAVTGTVQALVGSTHVQIEILDIRGARQLISFESDLGSGNDEAFAQGVAKVLVAAINGEVGQEKDIREGEPKKTNDPAANAAVAAQLAELSREMGDVTAVISRTDRTIKRTTYTMDDLSKKMEGEGTGTKAWERLGMKPGEYLRYKNSGLNLIEWRARAEGRRGQLIIRPSAGFASGPYDGLYYGRTAFDDHLVVVDAYSAQAVQTGSGGMFGATVAYGITPTVDIGATFSVATGNFVVDVGQQTGDQPISNPEPDSFGQTTLVFGPRVTVALLPVRPIRPSFGGSMLVMRGRTTIDPAEVPPSLTTFAPAVMMAGELFVGGEARISKRVDFFLHVPVQVRVAGSPSITDRVGTQEVVDATPPAVAGVIGAGVDVGLQIRLFGAKPKETTRYDEMDEPDE